MKIIHTADWHIGKIVNEFSMIEDQRFILNSLIELIKTEKPHALIIAGDVYDRSVPPVEAVELLDEVFCKILLELKIPILVIAGNHDGGERIAFASRILTSNGLHIAGSFNGTVEKVALNDEYGRVDFYLLPYEDPRQVKHVLKDEEINSHDMAFKKIIEGIGAKVEQNERRVLVTHGYITAFGEEKEETCESERPLSIGGTDLVNYEYFSGFTYTALGHLHGPQRVKSDKTRYSGSLLKYSFSEANHKKGVTIVHIDEAGEVKIEHKELLPRRDMRVIKGPIDRLLDPKVYKSVNTSIQEENDLDKTIVAGAILPNTAIELSNLPSMEPSTNDYVYAILTDEGELVDPISKLRAVYPNIMGLARERAENREKSRTSASVGYKQKTKLELFEEFYESINGVKLNQKGFDFVKEIVEQVEKEV